MFCHKCGAQLADGAVFCQKCGTKVASVDAVQETQKPQEIQEPIEIPEPNIEDQYSSEVVEDSREVSSGNTDKKNGIFHKIVGIGPVLTWVPLILLLPFWPLRISPAILVSIAAVGMILSAIGARPLGLTKIIEIAVAVILLVVIVATSMSSGGKNDKYVQIVKNGTLNTYPQMTVGKAFDSFLDNPKWESGLSENNERFVNVKGGILYYEKEAELVVQFFVDEKNESFQYNACEINGVPQNNLIFWNLLETIYNNGSASTDSNSRNGLSSVLEEITVGETHSFDDEAFGNLEVTLDYVQFTDRLLNTWTGLDEYPDEDFVFLWAAITVKNIGTANGTLPTVWNTIVYDNTYEFGHRSTTDSFIGIPPLAPSEEGAIIFMVPTAVIESNESLVLNINDGGGKPLISFTIRPGDGVQGSPSNGTAGMECYTSTDELLFDGFPAFEWIGASLEPIMSEWGTPLSFTEGWGVNYCEYDGIEFEFDAYRIIYAISMSPKKCSLGGRSLDKTRSELIEILGTPMNEDWGSRYNYETDEHMEMYYLEYDGGNFRVELPSYDGVADRIYIWG